MTNKIKLLLWSFLTILFVWLSSTYALELRYLRSSDQTCLANKNGKNLFDPGSNYSAKYYFSCIQEGLSQSELDKFWRKIQVEQFESKTYKLLYSEESSIRPFYYSNVIHWGAFSDYFKLWKDEKGLYVFSKFTKENNTIYRRNMLKITEDTPVKVVSRRGWTVYKQGYVLNGIQLYTKHGNQGRLASVIDNTYILDWYGFLIDNRTLRVMDTYSNKLYKYKTLTDNDLKNLPRVLFYNLYNNIPDDIYDIVWNKWSYWYFYWKDGEYINYELENSKKGTEEDLKKIQQDLKNSIQILNKEDIDFYLGMQPEELGISNNPDLPNTSWSNVPSTSLGTVQKKACIDYYSKMKAFTAHSDWCFGDWSNAERTMYRTNVIDGEYKNYNTRDKARYRRCWQFANYREEIQKQMPLFWQFLTEFKDKFLWLSAKDVDVNALCSHIQLNSAEKLAEAKDNNSIWKKISGIWNGNSGDPLTVDWSWNALYQNDFQKELRDLHPYYWQCKGYDKYWLKKLTNQTEEEKLNACKWYERKKLKLIDKWKWVELEYTNDSTVEWQVKLLEKSLWSGKGMLESVWSGVSSVLSEWWDVLLKTVKDPFYSGYNSVLSLQCSQSFRWQAMDYVLLWLFAMIAFYLFKTI